MTEALQGQWSFNWYHFKVLKWLVLKWLGISVLIMGHILWQPQ